MGSSRLILAALGLNEKINQQNLEGLGERVLVGKADWQSFVHSLILVRTDGGGRDRNWRG